MPSVWAQTEIQLQQLKPIVWRGDIRRTCNSSNMVVELREAHQIGLGATKSIYNGLGSTMSYKYPATFALDVMRSKADDARAAYENAISDHGYDSGEAQAALLVLGAARQRLNTNGRIN